MMRVHSNLESLKVGLIVESNMPRVSSALSFPGRVPAKWIRYAVVAGRPLGTESFMADFIFTAPTIRRFGRRSSLLGHESVCPNQAFNRTRRYGPSTWRTR